MVAGYPSMKNYNYRTIVGTKLLIRSISVYFNHIMAI